MKCDGARVYVSRELDGELPTDRWAVLRRHLDQCDQCDRFAQYCRGLQRLIETSPPPAPTPAMADGMLEEVRQAVSWRRNVRGTGKVLRDRIILAGSIIFALLLGLGAGRLWVMRGRPSRSTGPKALLPYDPAALGRLLVGPSADRLAECWQSYRDEAQEHDARLRWVAWVNGRLEVGLAGQDQVPATAEEPVAVQMWLFQTPPDSTPRLMSAPILIIRPGSTARFPADGGDRRGPPYGTYECSLSRRADGTLRLMTRLEVTLPHEAQPVQVSGLLDLTPGGPQVAAYSRAGTVSYALLARWCPNTPVSGSHGPE